MHRDYRDVMIGTPVRDGRFHTGYVVGIMQSNGLHNGWAPFSGQSDPYVARNIVLNAFWAQKQYNTLVCIDSDIGFTRRDFQALIHSDGEVVSGIYTDKNQPPAPFCRDYKGDMVPSSEIPDQGMIKSMLMPGGFLKIERSALEKVINGGHVTMYGDESNVIYAFYETRYMTLGGGTRLMASEDFSLGLLLHQAGVQGWTNCGIRVNHDGRTWNGKIVDQFA